MRTQNGFRLTAVAIAAALALVACDQRNNAAAGRTDKSTATAPASDASQKMAAATDKMTAAVDDSALTAKVKAALLAEPGLRSLQIGVDTKNATVTFRDPSTRLLRKSVRRKSPAALPAWHRSSIS